MTKYAASTDEERYHGSYDNPADAAADYLEGSDEGAVVWVGRFVPPPAPEGYFDIEDFIDHVSCQDSYCGEWAEDWILCTKDQLREINEQVRSVIGYWLDKHDLRPKFYNIEDPEKWELVGDEPRRVTPAPPHQAEGEEG